MSPYYEDESVTLYHGDALRVLQALPDESIDSMVTDPPYKLSQEYGTGTDADNLLAVSSVWGVAAEALRVVKPGSLCAMFYDTRILPVALEAMRSAGWKYTRGLTLYRRWGQASMFAGWMTTSDFILIFAKPGVRPTYHGSAKHDVYIRDKPEPVHYGHPAQKPLEHCRHIVDRITPPGGVVLDPYAGSGTTAEAAVLEGRRVVAIEREARFLPTIVTRCQNRQANLDAQGALDFGGAA